MIPERNQCDCICHEEPGKPCPQDSFCCPGRIPASVPNTRFGASSHCQDTIPTPRFNSPNSPLPPDKLNLLKSCIEEINDTLRTIGNPRIPEDPNQRQLQLHFRALRGTLVKVLVDCETCEDCQDDQHRVELMGVIEEAGSNFIKLNTLGEKKFIQFNRICLLKHDNFKAETFEHEQELLEIDECNRREITLNFGQIVGRSPELINLFFGIPLHLYLLPLIGRFIEVKTDEDEVAGVLCAVEENQIRIQLNDDEHEDQDEDQVEKDDQEDGADELDEENEQVEQVVENQVDEEEEEPEPEDPCNKIEDGVRTINFEEICFITIESKFL